MDAGPDSIGESGVPALAVEERYVTTPVNPLTTVKWVAPKSAEEVDLESVANPRQVRSLLKGVHEQGPRGAHLEAFFGCLYDAAMRPAEATALRREQCHLPETGWGTLTLCQGATRAGRNWTDDGQAHEMRQLKARAVKDSRLVPIPPHFVRLLRQHIATHGVAPDGRLFRTNRGGLLHETGYGEVWARARKDVLTEQEAVSLLARRPYDLRHDGVSFWLSSGVDPMECARRAGPFCSGCARRCWRSRRSVPTIGSMRRCVSGTNRSEGRLSPGGQVGGTA